MPNPSADPDTLLAALSDVDHAMLRAIGEARIDVISAVYWTTHASWGMTSRYLGDDFLFIPLDGSLNVDCLGQQESCLPGSCLMIPEGTKHSVFHGKGCKSLHVIAIHAHINRQDNLSFFNKLSSCVLPFPLGLKQACLELISIFNQDPVSGSAYGKSLIRQLLSHWSLAGHQLHQAEGHDPRISQALQVIHQHYMGALNVSDLAKEVKLGLVQFRTLFRRNVGQSPKLYIAHYRLRQAAALLSNTNDSVKTIAYAVGFQDEHYFHNSFKRFYHCTPNQYRQRINAEA